MLKNFESYYVLLYSGQVFFPKGFQVRGGSLVEAEVLSSLMSGFTIQH